MLHSITSFPENINESKFEQHRSTGLCISVKRWLISPPTGAKSLPHSWTIRTQEWNEETTQIYIVRIGYVAKVKLYLFSIQSIKYPGSTTLFSFAIVIWSS